MPFHGDHRAPAAARGPGRVGRRRPGPDLPGAQRAAARARRDGARLGEDVGAGMIFVDGVDIGDPDDVALRDRRTLSADGVFIVVATISSEDGVAGGAARDHLPRRPVPRGRRGRRAASRSCATWSTRRSRTARAHDGAARARPDPGGPPRRHRRVRLRAPAAPADDPAGRRRGLDARAVDAGPGRVRVVVLVLAGRDVSAGLSTSAFVTACTLAGVLAAGARRRPSRCALRRRRSPRQCAEAQLVRAAASTTGCQVSRYQQRVGGYPVLGGEATVVQAPGEPARIAADATAAVRPRSRAGACGEDLAAPRDCDRAALGQRAGVRHGDARRRASPSTPGTATRSSGASRCRRRDLQGPRGLRGRALGKVLASATVLQYATGKAKLFNPNPPVEQGGYGGIGTGAARRPQRPEHRQADRPPRGGDPAPPDERQLPQGQVRRGPLRQAGQEGLPPGSRNWSGCHALRRPVRGADGVLPHRPHAGLHPEPRLHGASRASDRRPSPEGRRRRVRDGQLVLLFRRPQDGTAPAASTTPRTPT